MTQPWQLADLVTRLRRTLRSSVRADVAWEQLPMAQVELLQRLVDTPGLRVSELAVRHRLAPNTVSTLVQQMVEAGLVVREPDPSDRRAVTVAPTERGREQLAVWAKANRDRLDSALGTLSERDRAAIVRALPALGRLVERLELDDTGDQPR